MLRPGWSTWETLALQYGPCPLEEQRNPRGEELGCDPGRSGKTQEEQREKKKQAKDQERTGMGEGSSGEGWSVLGCGKERSRGQHREKKDN